MSLVSILPELAFLDAITQDNTLAREFKDALYIQTLFRGECTRERWVANLGESHTFTRAGLLTPVVAPITPGQDPTPKTPQFEQWGVLAAQYTDSLDIHMPSSRTALASLFLRHARTLGLQAGQSMNRVSRNKLFTKYCGGHTVATTTEGGGSTTLPVASLNGFTKLIKNGAEVDVSASNPKNITIGGTAAVVTAATPSDSSMPLGAGTLTLSASATWTSGDAVLAEDRPYIIRSGGGDSVDALSTSDVLTVANIREAVAHMDRDGVPRHPDGYYHMHVDPKAMAQVYGDNEFQNFAQGELDSIPYREFALGKVMGCIVYKNNQSPNVNTSAPTMEAGLLTSDRLGTSSDARLSPEFWAEMRNASGVGLVRTIITGGDSCMEEYIDETSEYMTEAGVVGKVGSWAISSNGMQVPLEGVRFILRAPQDRLQQIVAATWSWSGDWGVPADLLGGQSAGRYKRAVCIESGSSD